MQIFLIIVIIGFAFVIGNHILDMKAPEEKVEDKLVNKKI
mgnify:FL=1